MKAPSDEIYDIQHARNM